MEFPHLQKIYKKHKANGLEIVAINVGRSDTAEDVAKYVKQHGLTFIAVKNGTGSQDMMKAYKGRGCPTSYLVGKDRKIISRWVGFSPSTGAAHLKEEFAKAGFK